MPRGFPGIPENWESEWETFAGSDGSVQLFAVTHRKRDLPAGKPVRALLVVHGLGEHGGRYQHVPHYLVNQVDVVQCLDQRGHGRSEGLRGYSDRFEHFSNDVALAATRLHDKLTRRHGPEKDKVELHLLAHSFGGLVGIHTLFRHPSLPFRSATLTAPLLAIAVKVNPVKYAAGLVLSKLWGTVHMTSEIDPIWLSHDPEVAKAYVEDRLNHSKITPRLFTEMLAAMADCNARDSGIEVPAQFLIPMQDKLVDPEAGVAFAKKLKHRAKRLQTYPDLYHEVLNERGKEAIFGEVGDWITQHSKL